MMKVACLPGRRVKSLLVFDHLRSDCSYSYIAYSDTAFHDVDVKVRKAQNNAPSLALDVKGSILEPHHFDIILCL